MFHQKFGWERVMAAGQVGGTGMLCPGRSEQAKSGSNLSRPPRSWLGAASSCLCVSCVPTLGLSGGVFLFLSSCLYCRDHTCLVPGISLGPGRSSLSLSWDIFCLRPGISHFSRKTWYLLMQNGISRPPSGHRSF